LYYETYVFRVWADVTDCPQPACVCEVKINRSEDEPQPLEFLKGDKANLGFVDFSNLKSNTNYSFTLTCKQDRSSMTETLDIKTDYGIPEAPKNINVSVASDHVQITWSPPSIPESFSYYKILLDSQVVEPKLSNNETSYKIIRDLTEGTYVIYISTCYENIQNITICSNPSDAKAPFIKATATTTPTMPITTTTTTTPAPTQKSSGVYSYSFSISTILSSLFLLNKI
jgi:hypothetical protein